MHLCLLQSKSVYNQTQQQQTGQAKEIRRGMVKVMDSNMTDTIKGDLKRMP